MTLATAHIPDSDPAADIAWAGLLRCAEPPAPGPLLEFTQGLGSVDAFAAIAHRQAPQQVLRIVNPRLGDRTAHQIYDQAAADVAAAAAVGADIIGPEHADWPADAFYPLELHKPYEECRTAAPPLALYRRATRWFTDATDALSLVGSRAATPYGTRIATQLGYQAASAGYWVISGAAFGIDAAAHRGALHSLESGGQAGTVAVLACGIDRPYPAAHRELLDHIADSGAVVSEYPPGFTPARYRFLVRNRLIAALSQATIVVEAGRRSGSLNTATSAANLGRQVFAVPGPVTSALSMGSHSLIFDGKATICTEWDQIASLLGPLQPAPLTHRENTEPTDGLDFAASRVYEALPARGSLSTADICRQAALPTPEVLGALAVLRIEKLAEPHSNGWRRKTRS